MQAPDFWALAARNLRVPEAPKSPMLAVAAVNRSAL